MKVFLSGKYTEFTPLPCPFQELTRRQPQDQIQERHPLLAGARELAPECHASGHPPKTSPVKRYASERALKQARGPFWSTFDFSLSFWRGSHFSKTLHSPLPESALYESSEDSESPRAIGALSGFLPSLICS